jgi:hypothetical protein
MHKNMTSFVRVAAAVSMTVMATALIPVLMQPTSAQLWWSRTREEIKAELQQELREALVYFYSYRELTPEKEQKILNLWHGYLATFPQTEAAKIQERRAEVMNAEVLKALILPSSPGAMRTEDDGYTYPENATVEEKAAIDVQERKAWEDGA